MEQNNEKKQIGFYFKQINETLTKKANSLFSSVGLTMAQTQIILYIYESPEHLLTQKQLEDILKVSHPTINGIIKRLEANGFVTTQIQTKGRLSKDVFLTPKAQSIIQNFESSKDIVDHMLCHALSDSEKVQLQSLLAKVLNGLNDLSEDDENYSAVIEKTKNWAKNF